MQQLRVCNLSISADGYVAGPRQGMDAPLGVGGERLHEWLFATRSWRQSAGLEGGDEGIDDDFAARGDVGFGSTIIGRNMFGPIRGPWEDDEWTGWWGDNPPFHHPVFVLTNHPRPSITMDGGTVFHFVSDGIHSALSRAREAADGTDVRLGGGAKTIQQFLQEGLVDELHLAVVPTLLYRGSRLFKDDDAGIDGYECIEYVPSANIAHMRFQRSDREA